MNGGAFRSKTALLLRTRCCVCSAPTALTRQMNSDRYAVEAKSILDWLYSWSCSFAMSNKHLLKYENVMF